MKISGKILCVFLSLFLLVVTTFPTFACKADGIVYVNGEQFSGTIAEAITAAVGGVVEISGKVYTEPVGKNDGTLIHDVTIRGTSDDAEISLNADFVMGFDDNLDVLSIKGNNVTIEDIEIDATLRVDYAICVFCGIDNIVIDNVSARKGIRGGINVMTGGNVLFKDVRADDSLKAGFIFESTGDASNIIFENCTTQGNWYGTGLVVKNCYGPCYNVNASGLTCYEDAFGIHDRVYGAVAKHGERAGLTVSVPPSDSSGNPINLDTGLYYFMDEPVYHIMRFGKLNEKKLADAKVMIKTDMYGYETSLYFPTVSLARSHLQDGDKVVVVSHPDILRELISEIYVILSRFIAVNF